MEKANLQGILEKTATPGVLRMVVQIFSPGFEQAGASPAEYCRWRSVALHETMIVSLNRSPVIVSESWTDNRKVSRKSASWTQE